jgi:hypothetical protein
VDEDACATGDGQADEADPPQHRVDAGVLGETSAEADGGCTRRRERLIPRRLVDGRGGSVEPTRS